MRKIWGIGLTAAWISWAQTPVPTREQVEREIQSTLRGRAEEMQMPTGTWGRAPLRPTGQTISVAQLQHRVSKEARKAFGRAKKLSKAGNHEQAAKELETAAALDPEFAAAWGELGAEYSRLGRFAEAEAMLNRSLALDGNPWNVHYNLAVVRWQRWDLSGAQQSARMALARAPGEARVHLLLGSLLYEGAETKDEGIQHVRYAARRLKAAKSFLRGMQAP